MNTRIHKMLSVLAVLGIVASSFVWALPVAAATPGDEKWAKQDAPSSTDNVLVPGSSILDIAVATDGKTIYVADAKDGEFIYKSTDGGKTFDSVKNDYGGGLPVAVAVAPDDVNVAAVANKATVWITRDGGTTWSDLGAPTLNGGNITDVAVAPSRSGMLLGREYIITVADPNPGVTAGNILTIGKDTTWKSVATSGIAGVADFTSMALSPNYAGDRSIVAVGTGNETLGATKVFIVNVSSEAVVGTPTAIKTDSGTVDYGNGTANNIISSSISLPSNFDPSSGSNSRAYIGINSNNPNDNDVYRYTDEAVRALGADARVNSVAFAGTVSSGKLFVGLADSSDVKYSSNPTATDPDWDTNDSSLTGDATSDVVVVTASDFATSNKVFAGTQGVQSAFFISEDAAISFYGQSLVNLGADVTVVPSPSLSFTGNIVFLTSTSGNYFSIWKSDVPFTSTSWKRIYAQTGSAGAGFTLSVNPAYSTTPALFIFETKIKDAKIYVSQDGGITWATRYAPTGVIRGSSSLRDAQTIYFIETTGDLYKSTNAAWTWGDAVDTGLSSASSLTLPAANQVIASGNSVAMSTDDGETFTLMDNGLTTANDATFTVQRDGQYATNKLIYTVNTNSTSNDIYRVDASNTDNTWDAMDAPIDVQITDLDQRSGVLYATTVDKAVGVVRTLFPADTIGDQYWSNLVAGLSGLTLPAAPSVTATGSILLYMKDSTGNLYAYNDFLATMKPTLTTPADNYSLSVDPASGYGYATDLKFQPMTSNSTKVDAVDLEIVDKTNGFTGTPNYGDIPVTSSNPFVNTSNLNKVAFNLQPNHSYLWRIRARSTTTEADVISPWSDSRTINVQAGGQVVQNQAGVILQGPQPGAANVNPNLVGFSWAPVPGATEYQIIVATDAALTKTVAGTPAKVTTTSYQATGLTAGTTYFWGVQATQPTVSQQSVGTFTTAAAAQPQPTGGTSGGQPQQTVVVNVPQPETPAYIWAVIAIGAILIIAVIILIVRTRRVP